MVSSFVWEKTCWVHLARLDDGDISLQQSGSLLVLLHNELLLAPQLVQLAGIVIVTIAVQCDLSDDLWRHISMPIQETPVDFR